MNRQTWTDPGTIERGDYLEIFSVAAGRIYCAVALARECNDRVLIRNQHGIQYRCALHYIVNRSAGLAIMAGPKAHQNDPSLLHAGKKRPANPRTELQEAAPERMLF